MSRNNKKFIDHGIPVLANEARTSAICRRNDKEYFIICAKGFLVVINLESKEQQQAWFPEGYVDEPFACLSSRNGLFYTGAGKMFMEFDPKELSFTYYGYPLPQENIIAMRLAESPNGVIYFGTYPSCHLLAFHQGGKEIIDYGSMDETQKYICNMAVDRNGWVYIGIGTEKNNLIAFNPKTKERRQLVNEKNRKQGNGYVHLGRDSNVYGHFDSTKLDVVDEEGNFDWKIFLNGDATDIETENISPSYYYGSRFKVIHSPLADSSRIKEYRLDEHELILQDSKTGKSEKIRIEYKTAGANLSPMAAGPDGNLYGTSNHPLHFYTYKPKLNQLLDFGGKEFQKEAKGNICAYAIQGDIIAGAAYAGGHIILFDTTRPVNIENKSNRNPLLVSSHEEIHRPRCAVNHIDGKHVIFGGFAGYGAAGGGLCIYNIETSEDVLITNQKLLRFQSTLCMKVLKNGDIIAGTSIETPGGAIPKAAQGEIYCLDWKTRKIKYHIVPLQGTREISLMEIDQKQLLHCLTSDSRYFVFDPFEKEVLHCIDLSKYGSIVRDGLAKGKDNKIYGLLTKAIFCIDPDTFSVDILADPVVHITAGIAIIEDRLYFGSTSHLWSYKLSAY